MGRILVVDDSKSIRLLVNKILTDVGHDVLLAEDAFSAYDYLDKFKFDLVILDLNMPKKSGFSLLQELRARLTSKFVPVAILTSRSRDIDVKRAINLNAMAFIVKPFTPESLMNKVNFVLENNKTRLAPEVELSTRKNLSAGKIHISTAIQIVKVVEMGVRIQCQIPLEEGQLLTLGSPLFEEIGVSSPNFRVVTVTRDAGKTLASLVFDSINQEDLQKIHMWIAKASAAA